MGISLNHLYIQSKLSWSGDYATTTTIIIRITRVDIVITKYKKTLVNYSDINTNSTSNMAAICPINLLFSLTFYSPDLFSPIPFGLIPLYFVLYHSILSFSIPFHFSPFGFILFLSIPSFSVIFYFVLFSFYSILYSFCVLFNNCAQ